MKNSLITLFITIGFLSCSVKNNKITKLTQTEITRYSVTGDTIYLDGQKIAYLNLIEWEYSRNKLIQEISIVQLDQTDQDGTLKLIAWVHKKHPKAKIEIKFHDKD